MSHLPMNQNTAPSIDTLLYEFVRLGEVLEQIVIIYIINFYHTVLESAEKLLI